jgi:hypothetical protein
LRHPQDGAPVVTRGVTTPPATRLNSKYDALMLALARALLRHPAALLLLLLVCAGDAWCVASRSSQRYPLYFDSWLGGRLAGVIGRRTALATDQSCAGGWVWRNRDGSLAVSGRGFYVGPPGRSQILLGSFEVRADMRVAGFYVPWRCVQRLRIQWHPSTGASAPLPPNEVTKCAEICLAELCRLGAIPDIDDRSLAKTARVRVWSRSTVIAPNLAHNALAVATVGGLVWSAVLNGRCASVAIRALRLERLRRCRGCGYLLVGLPDRTCPECGRPFAPLAERGPDTAVAAHARSRPPGATSLSGPPPSPPSATP